MREIQNDCCGCPGLRCNNCEKGKDYEVIYCDICGESESTMYEYGDKDCCEDCLFVIWLNNYPEDIELIVKPGTENINQVLEYLAECVSNDPNEILYYLSETSRNKWEAFKEECAIEE